jgi:Histidine kinase
MTEQDFISYRRALVRWLPVAAATALACYLGYWYLQVGGRAISLMWPAAGVSVAFFVRYGVSVAPAVMAGHMILCFFIVPSRETWPILLVPLLYPMEAWLVSRVTYKDHWAVAGRGSALWPVAWNHLGAPILCSIPCAFLITAAFTLTGRFPADAMGMTMFLIVMAHIHGIMAFGGLTLHVLQRDFNYAELKEKRYGIIAGSAALMVMFLAFSGVFDEILSQQSALFLPFPLLVMAAVWLPPAPVSAFVALWCVLSTALTCVGLGPFSQVDSLRENVMHPAELGIYNTVMASVAYLISVGSHHLLRQLNLNEIALNAAGIELWEWQAGRGFSSVQGNEGGGRMRETTAGRPDREALAKLAGLTAAGEAPADSWRTRIETGGASLLTLESVGRVLQRGIDSRPTRAIGLIQDLSAARKAEDALVALGHQKAKLRDLQAKLNPHFLFNSLNVIRALVHCDTKSADEAITSLAELLRSNLRTTDTTLIALGEELGQIRALLHLARLRFGSRLETRIRVPRDLMETPVPPMLLLNLVENAITHGIGNLESGGTISVTARNNVERVHISIRNTGTLAEKSARGIGTRDALQRLELLFHGRAGFSLSQLDERTVSADVILPFPPSPHP